MTGDLAERVREAVSDLMLGLSLDLVEVSTQREGGDLYLRLAIDKQGGVTVEDCAHASGLVEKVLEREKLVEGPYVLEVMSPGLERRLKRAEDFKKSVGKRVKVKFREPYRGKRTHTGMIIAAGDEVLTLDLGGEETEVRYNGLSAARLYPELPW